LGGNISLLFLLCFPLLLVGCVAGGHDACVEWFWETLSVIWLDVEDHTAGTGTISIAPPAVDPYHPDYPGLKLLSQ